MAGVDVSRWNLGLPLALLGGCTRITYLEPEEGETRGDSSGSSTEVSASITVADDSTAPESSTKATTMEASDEVDPSIGECDACQPGECCIANECLPAPYDCPRGCPLELCCYQACPSPYDCDYDEPCPPGAACDSYVCTLLDPEPYCDPPLFFEQPVPMLEAIEISALAFVDADGDALRDLVVGSSERVQIVRGQDGVPYDIAFGLNVTGLAIGDLDGDGDEDIVIGDGNPEGGVIVMLHYDAGSFLQLPTMPLPGSITQVVLADIDGQGIPGVVALDDIGVASWLRNVGTGELEPAYAITEPATALAVGMLDADESTDLVFHQVTNEVAYLGGPAFVPTPLYESGDGATSRLVTVGDFDGSGPDDVVALEAVAGTTISAHWSGPVTVGFVAYRSWW
ncbi:MAG: VCBS repeat-containing protein, partial [Deltaproteobacteria bacterium]|nr:VCBS repeat-containing protein [Nannocystaceae bacterium]